MPERDAACVVSSLVLVILSGSAVSAVAVDLAQSAAEKPDDVQLQTVMAEAMRTSPLTADSRIVVHVNQEKAISQRLSVVNTQIAEIPSEK